VHWCNGSISSRWASKILFLWKFTSSINKVDHFLCNEYECWMLHFLRAKVHFESGWKQLEITHLAHLLIEQSCPLQSTFSFPFPVFPPKTMISGLISPILLLFRHVTFHVKGKMVRPIKNCDKKIFIIDKR